MTKKKNGISSDHVEIVEADGATKVKADEAINIGEETPATIDGEDAEGHNGIDTTVSVEGNVSSDEVTQTPYHGGTYRLEDGKLIKED